MAVKKPVAAASPPANTPGRSVMPVSRSTQIWPPFVRTPSQPVRKSSTMAWPTAKITLSVASSKRESSMATGWRRPDSSGSPSSQRTSVMAATWPASSAVISMGCTRNSTVSPSSRASSSSVTLAGISTLVRR